MKKNKLLFLGLIMALAIVISLGNMTMKKYDDVEDDNDILIIQEEPHNIPITYGESAWASKYLANLTIPMLINDSELVAVVRISSKGTYYSKYPRLPFTLYKGEIQNIIKGTCETEEITLIIYGGYVREDWFTVLEGEPEFAMDDNWLLFLRKREYESDFEMELPSNTYRPIVPMNMKIENNMLHPSIDNHDLLLPKFNITDMSLDDFTDEYKPS